MNDNRLTAGEVQAFIRGQVVECFDPDSGFRSATIEYLKNGTCHADMADGASDDGHYGFEGDLYWTQYTWFRNGDLHRFYLVRVEGDACQAYFADGTKAFFQSIRK